MQSDNSAELTSGDIKMAGSPISPSTPVREALAWMQRSGQQAIVVMDGARPVGVITDRALRGRDLPDAAVQDVMDLEVVRVDPSLDVEDTLRAFREAAWHSVRRRHPVAPRAGSH